MTNFSRRRFLKQLGSFSAVFLTAPNLVFPSFDLRETSAPFEFLVIGDSLVWGQGLDEKDKFYTLTKNWLESEIFAQKRAVNLKVKAHSGATLTLSETEAEALRKAGKDETKYLPSEINVAFPSIKSQVDIALKEYEAEQKPPEAVKLIMLSGSITDISVAAILNPFGDNKKLRSDIAKYAGDSMTDVLTHAAKTFPNALVAVLGYFPMISPQTSTHELFNFLLEAYGFPRPLKPLANNLITKQLFKIIRQKAVKRARIWTELSTAKLQESVDKLNAGFNARRAVFVTAPITEETCFGTKNTLVFRMVRKGRIEDRFYDRRKAQCKPLFKELKASTGIKYPIRFCEIAAVGHPNVEGSKAFFGAIKETVAPHFTGEIPASAEK
jgi:hypothetical protein